MTVDDMRMIVSRLTVGGRRATISFITDLMREAMLARNYLSSHQYVFSTVLPEEQWEDWLKVNQRVVIEASPVSVEDFMDQVDEPSEEELAEFFETYRDVQPTPDILAKYGDIELPRATPAFATPARVKMQYAVLEFDTLLQKTLDEVTDEEIETYYNENKEQFINADEGLFGGEGLFGDDEEEGESEPVSESEESAAVEETAVEESAEEESSTEEDTTDTSSQPASEDASSDSDATENTEATEEEEEETRNKKQQMRRQMKKPRKMTGTSTNR